jgi:glutamyl-tRNA reductase
LRSATLTEKATLRQKAEDIRQSELSKTLPRLRNLSDRDLNIVQALTARIINKLLHGPVSELRAKGDPEQAELILELFFLTVGEPTKGEQVKYRGQGLTEEAV